MGNCLSGRNKNKPDPDDKYDSEPEVKHVPEPEPVKSSQKLTIGLTEVENESFEFYWIVKNFSQLDSTILSPYFTGGKGIGQKWILTLDPKTETLEGYLTFICLALNNPAWTDKSTKFKINFTLNGLKVENILSNVINESNGITVFKSLELKGINMANGVDFANGFNWANDPNNRVWPCLVKYPKKVENDQIVIVCQVLMQNPVTKSQIVDDDFFNSIKLKPYEKNLDKFLYDFGKFLNNPGEQWDLRILVGGRDFKVHKAILSARSPVFSRMLSTQMKEGQSSTIRIDDCEPEIVQNMLEFIYTGKTDLDQNVLELFQISDKYDLPDLKAECEMELVKNLNFENALGLFDMGDKFNAPVLKSLSTEFIIRNDEEIMKYPGFKENLKNNNQLSFEILEAVLLDKKEQNPKWNFRPINLD